MNRDKKAFKQKVELYIKRKTYVSTIGWVGAILSGILIYFSLFGILNIILFNSNPLIRSLSGSGSQEVTRDFFTFSFLIGMFYLFIISFGFIFLRCFIGLLKFREWARALYVKMSWVLIALSVTACIIYIFKSGDLLPRLIQNELGMSPEGRMSVFLKTLFGVQIVSFGILLIFLSRTLLKVSNSLRRVEYKKLFK